MRVGAVQRLAKAAAGIDQRRSVPAFAAEPLRRWARGTSYAASPGADTATTSCSGRTRSPTRSPPTADAPPSRVLEAAGLRVGVVAEHACCGLTWVSTGQLTAARRIVGHTLDVLHPYVAAGIPVVGLEPSCLATLRSDAVELTADPRAAEVAAGVRSLAEVLSGLPGWTPPDLTGTTVVVQPHCHHASVRGLGGRRRAAGPDRRDRHPGRRLLRAGRQLRGRAGPLRGVGRGGRARPAARPSAPRGADAVVLADGFSCRTQLDDLAGVRALHLAELLAAARAGTAADRGRGRRLDWRSHRRGARTCCPSAPAVRSF